MVEVSGNNHLSLKNLDKGYFSLVQHCNGDVLKSVRKRKQKGMKPLEVKYTKAERKKLKHQKKMAKIRYLQEQVAMGLIEPPKNKESFKTLMRTINYDKDIGAVATPTMKGQQIQQAINDRALVHQANNALRKLTPAEKWRKKLAKVQKDVLIGSEVIISVFLVDNLLTPLRRASSLKYKIDINAQKIMLNGLVLTVPNGKSLVFVEGGPRRVYEFDKLMKRLDWTSVPKEEEKEEAEAKAADTKEVITPEMLPNACLHLWSGYFPEPSFYHFDFIVAETVEEAGAILRPKNLIAFLRSLTRKA